MTKKQEKIVRLKKGGHTFQETAKQAKCSVSSAKKYWYRYKSEHPDEVTSVPAAHKSARDHVHANRHAIDRILRVLADFVLNYPLYTSLFIISKNQGEYKDICDALGQREIAVWKLLFDVNLALARELAASMSTKPWKYWNTAYDEAWALNAQRWRQFLAERAPDLLKDFM